MAHLWYNICEVIGLNLPNKLTMGRIILIPVLIVIYLLENIIGSWTFLLMGVVFVMASATDYLDGKIARKRNLVTTFGKFIDPLADKLLVMAALLVLSDAYAKGSTMWMPFWIVILILSREFIVTSIRLVAIGEGKVIAASKLGKYKTALTMATILWYFFLHDVSSAWVIMVGITLILFSTLMTFISGIDYFWKNRKIIFASV